MVDEGAGALDEVNIDRPLELMRQAEIKIADLLCDTHDPEAIAYKIVQQDGSLEVLTYSDLTRDSKRFAAALASLGITPGDRVATLMGKSRAYLVALMGIWRLGAVHVPLFTAFAPSAIGLRLQGSKAKLVIADEAQASKLEPSESIPATPHWRLILNGGENPSVPNFHQLMSMDYPAVSAPAVAQDHPLIHIFTSGTTGKPKGVVVPVKALGSILAYAEFALDLRPDDLYWCAADPGWAYGLYFGILASFLTGTQSLLLEGGFTPESTLKVLSDLGVTNFAAAPTVYRAMRNATLQVPPDLRLRCASSAGEPLTPEVNDWAVEALGVAVYDHYGQTETGMLINNHHHPLLQRPLKLGSMGHPMPGWTAAILREDSDEPAGYDEVGRVALDITQSPLAWFDGYEGNPEKSAEKFAGQGRWYLTGDTGWRDEDGYFYFSARDDDVIIMAGYRIGPFEVESVIASHHAVAECAIIAVPDEVRGEIMEAFVVLAADDSGDDSLEKEIQQWVKSRYAAHAFPRKIHFVDSLPKTPSGKIMRFILKRERLMQLDALNSRN